MEPGLLFSGGREGGNGGGVSVVEMSLAHSGLTREVLTRTQEGKISRFIQKSLSVWSDVADGPTCSIDRRPRECVNVVAHRPGKMLGQIVLRVKRALETSYRREAHMRRSLELVAMAFWYRSD